MPHSLTTVTSHDMGAASVEQPSSAIDSDKPLVSVVNIVSEKLYTLPEDHKKKADLRHKPL